MLPLATFIHKKLVVLRQDTPLVQATRAICDNQIGCILIHDGEDNALGIITDRDFVCRGLLENKAPETHLKEIMSRDLVTADESSGLVHIIQLMEKHGVRRIPITHKAQNGKMKFTGIVTLDDLVASNQIDPSQLSRIIQRQIGRSTAYYQELKSEASKHSLIQSETHKLNTIYKFYSHLSKFMKTDRETIPQLAQFILGFLCMRVTFTGASHFMAQLPRIIQEQLLKLPAGPNRSYSEKRLIKELTNRFHFSEHQSRTHFSRFLFALNEWIGTDALKKLEGQLPLEYHSYFETVTGESTTDPKEQNKSRSKSKQVHLNHSPSWTPPETFKDRTEAAGFIAKNLAQYKDKNPLILGIPRGSMPMAKLLAQDLNGELDLVLVHKIGAPDNPEFAIGSVSEFGTIYRSEAADIYEISSDYLDLAAEKEINHLKQLRKLYTPIRPPIDPKDRVVILIDDGIATGSTMLAAIHAIRSKHPSKLLVTSPVASPEAVQLIKKEVDELVVLKIPREFFAVGQFYDSFPEVNDEEVFKILSQAGVEKKPQVSIEPEKKTA